MYTTAFKARPRPCDRMRISDVYLCLSRKFMEIKKNAAEVHQTKYSTAFGREARNVLYRCQHISTLIAMKLARPEQKRTLRIMLEDTCYMEGKGKIKNSLQSYTKKNHHRNKSKKTNQFPILPKPDQWLQGIRKPTDYRGEKKKT